MLGSFQESADAIVLSKRVKSGEPAGEQLVRIRLVPNIPDHLVRGNVIGGVKRDGEFDRAEVRTEVTTGLADIVENGLTQLISHLLQFLYGVLMQVGWLDNRAQQLVFAGHLNLS